jgi:glycosyltransferase involved in cell wall biosynthesis
MSVSYPHSSDLIKESWNFIMSIGIIYFGRRGGGSRQCLNILKYASEINIPCTFHISSKNELLKEMLAINSSNVFEYDIPSGLVELITTSPLRKNNILKECFKNLQSNSAGTVFFLMPHPWDFSMTRILRRWNNTKIYRAIHDADPHSGDGWPRKSTISRLTKNSDHLIFFSEYVANKVHGNKPYSICRIDEMENSAKLRRGEFVLFMGRSNSYKGLDNLLKAWPEVQSINKKLILAGNFGQMNTNRINDSTVYIQKWLTNEEILNLVDGAKLVVLPYQEASQSGLIPLALSRSTPVVITPVGGLQEQMSPDKNGVVCEDSSPKSIAKGLTTALNKDWSNDHFTRKSLRNKPSPIDVISTQITIKD